MDFRSPNDLREAARRRLPRMLFDYVDGSSGTEDSDRRNRADLRAITLPHRVMRKIPKADFTCTLIQSHSNLPVVLGPVGMAGLFARRGEVAAARAANEAGVPFCLSMMSVCAIEELAAAHLAPFWFQLYMLRDRGFVASLLERATAVGCTALVVTVDLPMSGIRYRDHRSGLVAPAKLRGSLLRGLHVARRPRWACDVGMRGRPHILGNLAELMLGRKAMGGVVEWIGRNYDPTVSWSDLDFIRRHWNGPIVVKGVLDPEDARQAADKGVDAIVVSNHGGRQLDGAPSTASVLPAIVDAVADIGRDMPVHVDGGAYTGSDVARFMRLGAQAVWLGRAWAFALAAGGEAGVAMLLRRIGAEIGLAAGFAAETR